MITIISNETKKHLYAGTKLMASNAESILLQSTEIKTKSYTTTQVVFLLHSRVNRLLFSK